MKRIFCLMTALVAVIFCILPISAAEPADTESYAGLWSSAEYELDTLWGRYHAAQSAIRVTSSKDDTLLFGDMSLTHVGDGVFLGESEAGIFTVSFTVDEAGTPTEAVFSDGRVLRPLPSYYDTRIVLPALAVVALLSLWFILSGAAVFVWSLFYREPNGRRRSIFYLLPHVFGALQCLVVLPQAAMVFFVNFDLVPIYRWLSVATLFLGLVATVCYIIAFVRSFFRRSLHHRVAYSAIAFVVLQILLRLFAIVPMP